MVEMQSGWLNYAVLSLSCVRLHRGYGSGRESGGNASQVHTEIHRRSWVGSGVLLDVLRAARWINGDPGGTVPMVVTWDSGRSR